MGIDDMLYGIFYNSFYTITEIISKVLLYFKYDNVNVVRETLIVDHSDMDIKIISVESVDHNNNYDYDNIQNYLRHHIVDPKHNFYKTHYNNPVFITFKYINKHYKICLKSMSSTHMDHYEIEETPRILYAIVKNHTETNVTDKIKEYHGNTKNFYSHIPDIITDLYYLLGHEGELHIFDMMGNDEITNLKK
jgi:hypothetical protein